MVIDRPWDEARRFRVPCRASGIAKSCRSAAKLSKKAGPPLSTPSCCASGSE